MFDARVNERYRQTLSGTAAAPVFIALLGGLEAGSRRLCNGSVRKPACSLVRIASSAPVIASASHFPWFSLVRCLSLFCPAEDIRLKDTVIAVPNKQHHRTFSDCAIVASLRFRASSIRQTSDVLLCWTGDNLSFGQVTFDDWVLVGMIIPSAFDRSPM